MPQFCDINFKYTDAEEERLYAPELIDEAYVDINQVLERFIYQRNSWLSGRKGLGRQRCLQSCRY